MKVNGFSHRLCLGLSVLFLATVSLAQKTDKIDRDIKEQKTNHRYQKQSQQRVSDMAEKTSALEQRYHLTLQKIENTKVYNQQLRKLIQSQETEMISMRKNIKELKRTSQEIVPLMVRMVDHLEKFIDLDLPFLPEERARRLKQLKEIMKRADVSNSEKYRRILEAYQIENEYGRTIEAYKDQIELNSKKLMVNFLRLGRVTLFYQSIDGSKSGVWDAQEKKWHPLSSDFRRPITDGIRIARKQLAPNLLTLPIPKGGLK